MCSKLEICLGVSVCSSHQVVHLRHSVDAGNVIRTNTHQNDLKYIQISDRIVPDVIWLVGVRLSGVFLDLCVSRADGWI